MNIPNGNGPILPLHGYGPIPPPQQPLNYVNTVHIYRGPIYQEIAQQIAQGTVQIAQGTVQIVYRQGLFFAEAVRHPIGTVKYMTTLSTTVFKFIAITCLEKPVALYRNRVGIPAYFDRATDANGNDAVTRDRVNFYPVPEPGVETIDLRFRDLFR